MATTNNEAVHITSVIVDNVNACVDKNINDGRNSTLVEALASHFIKYPENNNQYCDVSMVKE